MSKYENPSNNFNAKFDVVQAADRYVESIEDRNMIWTDVDKELGQADNIFESFGHIDLWDTSVDAWHGRLSVDPEEEEEEDFEDDDDFDYEDDDDWDYDDDDFDDDEDFDDDDND
jgi:hypothetical protein